MCVGAPKWQSHTPRYEKALMEQEHLAGKAARMDLGNIVLVGMLHDKRNRFKLNKEGLAGAPIW